MRGTWLRRAGLAAVLWVAVCGVALLAGAHPRPAVLAAMVVAAAAVAWVAADLGREVTAASWAPEVEFRHHERGADVRVRVLRRTLVEAVDADAFAEQVHPLLVELVDDRLDSSYGITRSEHPGAARSVLGPELSAFVERPPANERARDLQYLSDVLDRIDSL